MALDTGELVLIAGAGVLLYMAVKPKPMASTSTVYPQPNQYPSQQANPYPNTWGATPVSSPTAAQQAASVISAIGGLASGIGSVVRGIGDWGGGSDVVDDY